MTDQDYSKREIDQHFLDIKESLERQDRKLEEINGRAKETNGRVNALEGNRDFTRGALTILTAVMSVIVIPLMGWLITQSLKQNEIIDNSVKRAFQEITI